MLIVAAAILSTALICAGCGSTAPVPTQPSTVAPAAVVASLVLPAPPLTFPSLVGNWGGKVGIALLYQNPDNPVLTGTGSSHCDASVFVDEHTGNTLSASVNFEGTSLNSDKECGRGFAFTAAMAPEGTFTNLRFTRASLASFECYPASAPIFRDGSADSSGFRVVVVDSTVCRWPPLTFTNNVPTRETDRVFTIVVDFRRSSRLP